MKVTQNLLSILIYIGPKIIILDDPKLQIVPFLFLHLLFWCSNFRAITFHRESKQCHKMLHDTIFSFSTTVIHFDKTVNAHVFEIQQSKSVGPTLWLADLTWSTRIISLVITCSLLILSPTSLQLILCLTAKSVFPAWVYSPLPSSGCKGIHSKEDCRPDGGTFSEPAVA